MEDTPYNKPRNNSYQYDGQSNRKKNKNKEKQNDSNRNKEQTKQNKKRKKHKNTSHTYIHRAKQASIDMVLRHHGLGFAMFVRAPVFGGDHLEEEMVSKEETRGEGEGQNENEKGKERKRRREREGEREREPMVHNILLYLPEAIFSRWRRCTFVKMLSTRFSTDFIAISCASARRRCRESA